MLSSHPSLTLRNLCSSPGADPLLVRTGGIRRATTAEGPLALGLACAHAGGGGGAERTRRRCPPRADHCDLRAYAGDGRRVSNCVVVPGFSYCTYGYVLSRRGVQRLLGVLLAPLHMLLRTLPLPALRIQALLYTILFR